MKILKILMLSAVMGAAVTTTSANAEILVFKLSGSKNATFQIDTVKSPFTFSSSSLIGNSVAFSNVAGTFDGTQQTASNVSFGTGLLAALNVNGTTLGFTQFVGPNLFSGPPSAPVFNKGSFALRSIVSGSSTLDISSLAAAVPEPGTWALMIFGFGAIGVAMRRRSMQNVNVGYAF